MSCRPPRFSCGRGLPPDITSTEARDTCALAIPVMLLVMPGPAVTSATPSSPVSSACACAMWTAARSSRTSMIRMPSASRRIQIGMMWPPQSANTRVTPRRFKRRAIRSAALSGDTFIERLLRYLECGSNLRQPGDENRDGQDSEHVGSENRARGDAGLEPVELCYGEGPGSDRQCAEDHRGVRP